MGGLHRFLQLLMCSLAPYIMNKMSIYKFYPNKKVSLRELVPDPEKIALRLQVHQVELVHKYQSKDLGTMTIARADPGPGEDRGSAVLLLQDHPVQDELVPKYQSEDLGTRMTKNEMTSNLGGKRLRRCAGRRLQRHDHEGGRLSVWT